MKILTFLEQFQPEMSRWLDKILLLTDIFALLVFSQEAHLSTESPSQVFIDCYPQPGTSKELCELRGCTWKHVTGVSSNSKIILGQGSRLVNRKATRLTTIILTVKLKNSWKHVTGVSSKKMALTRKIQNPDSPVLF
jgi:hypothetical protein